MRPCCDYQVIAEQEALSYRLPETNIWFIIIIIITICLIFYLIFQE